MVKKKKQTNTYKLKYVKERLKLLRQRQKLLLVRFSLNNEIKGVMKQLRAWDNAMLTEGT